MAAYDAFISYSHAKDKPIAAALQSAVQKLGKPWYRRRALRLFRDDTSLAATPHLWPTIEQALGQSRHFILLASPEAAASKWVNKEVTYWLEHNSIDTLLIGLTDGEFAWDESAGDFSAWGDRPPPLPPALAKRFPSEPKWVDLRPYREGADRKADKRDAKFTELAADFAAAIRGMPKEDLLSQEVRQQRRALALAWSAAGALLVLALAAATAGVLAYHEEREAVAQRTRAEQTLAAATQTANSLVSDLAQRFRDTVGVPASLVKDILDRARALQQQLIKSGQATPDLLLSEANALAETSLTLLTIGDTAGALSAANQDRHILADLLATNPGNTGWQQDLSIAYQRIGSAQTARGDLPGALKSYGESRTILDRLIRSNSDKADWQQDLATLDELIADARKAQGDFAVALQAVRDGITIMERLVQAAPANTTWQYDLSLEYGRTRRHTDGAEQLCRRTEVLSADQRGTGPAVEVRCQQRPVAAQSRHGVQQDRKLAVDAGRSCRSAEVLPRQSCHP